LSNFNKVTEISLVALIVYAELGSASYIFTVLRMPDLKINGNLNALAAAVAYDSAGYSFHFFVLHFRLPMAPPGPGPQQSVILAHAIPF